MLGTDRLIQARRTLAGPGGDARSRLRLAGEEFWSAVRQSSDWQTQDQLRAYRVMVRLLSKGTVDKTVDRLEAAEVAEISWLISAFCWSAEGISLN